MEEVLSFTNLILQSLGLNPNMADKLDRFVILLVIALLAFITDIVVRKILVGIVYNIVKKTKNKWDDLFLDKKLLNDLALFAPAVLVYALLPLAFQQEPDILFWSRKFILVFMSILLIITINTSIGIVQKIAEVSQRLKGKTLNGFFQILKIIVSFTGAIIIVSIIIDKSPTTLFAGLGASAAVLMLVFKDTIVGFVSGILLSSNKMLRVGDWITCKKHNVNGVVIEISLNTVKIRNFDNTIITMPPYSLVSDSFQNWRNMQENGARRIMRSINIDMHSVKFCTKEMIEKYRKISLIKDYIDSQEKQFYEYNLQNGIDDSVMVNGMRLTNIGVFRAYLQRYIENQPTIDKNQIYMIRQMEPTENGLPIQIYFFTTKFQWVAYEGVMADVFDHIIAVIPEFDLNVFQNLTSKDIIFNDIKLT
ncbi:MAG: mechanosensitive ion channel [Paludibacteraceae bacterium]|nr:mechanosensitive ion channel [Paludibacteraceae bacterium]MBO5988652.1 mechanosensitive ion channel [Paludibacteraceae bacterium]